MPPYAALAEKTPDHSSVPSGARVKRYSINANPEVSQNPSQSMR